MMNAPCQFDGDCAFRNLCACNGNLHLLCEITYQAAGVCFVDKHAHPTCHAKTYFGDAHICLCPAKTNTP